MRYERVPTKNIYTITYFDVKLVVRAYNKSQVKTKLNEVLDLGLSNNDCRKRIVRHRFLDRNVKVDYDFTKEMP